MRSDAPSHAELTRTLAALRLGIHASDLHGSLTGYLCAGGHASADDWPGALQLDFDDATLARDAVLRRLYRSCREQFEGPCADVSPLLPVAGTPLAQRADALVEWCRGFLGGCGLAGALSHRSLSADASEILADFNTIAATHFDATDSAEDERAFADVVDFVRTAAALLHRNVNAAGPRGGHALH